MRRVKVGCGEPSDLACLPQSVELQCSLDIPRFTEIPPMKLHHIEPLDSQSLQRPVDHSFDVTAVNRLQLGQIRHEFGVNLDPRRQARMSPPEITDELLNS